jgi:hypothetical protein
MPRLTMKVAAKMAASLASEVPRVGDGEGIAIILSTEPGSDEGDDCDYQEAEETDGLDGDGSPYQVGTDLLMVSHHRGGTYSAESKGHAKADGKDGREPGKANRSALEFRGLG